MKTLLFSLILLATAPIYAAQKNPPASVADRKALKDADAPVILTYDAPGFCIFGGQSGNPYFGKAPFMSVVWRNDVVYIGETHDQPLDHQAQFEALKAMNMARGSKIAVGFEMLNQTLQPVLDDYSAGKISEEEFLVKTDWQKEWGFDFAMYKPMFDFIIQHKLRALALNVPRKVVAKIARGGLDSLTPEEKAFLPADLQITKSKKYNDYLKESFGEHGAGPMAKIMTLENYQASMAAWNEGMGARVAAFLNDNPGYAVLVAAGNGHLMYNAAIPASVKSRVKGARQASFYTKQADICPEKMPKDDKDIANYIWYINHPPKPASAAPPAISTPSEAPAAMSTATAPASPK